MDVSSPQAISLHSTSPVVSSSLYMGAVQRRDVDTVFTCLASNSNMTQASRAEIALQMNREIEFANMCHVIRVTSI